MFKKLLYRIVIGLYPIFLSVIMYNYIVNVEIVKMHVVSYFMISYVACLYLMYTTYYGNRIGTYRVSEIIYSNALSFGIVDVLFCLVLIVVNGALIDFSDYIIFVIFLQFIFTVIWAVICNFIYVKVYGLYEILLVTGLTKEQSEFANKLDKRKNRFDIKEVINQNSPKEEIYKKCEQYDCIMIDAIDNDLRNEITEYCFDNNKILFMVPKIPEIIRNGAKEVHITDTPLLATKKYALTIEELFVKRFIDLFISLTALIITSPFMLITALAIKLYDGGPILYKQKRLTYQGKVFEIYKFRSMIVDAEKNGARLSSGAKDDRITKVGKIIRAIRFDELPQLFNIIKGDMSIVGPRPERPEIAEKYYKDLPEFKYRLQVKAGLTGYAQVYGKYNTTPKDKLKLDLMYIQSYSLQLDLKIMLYTIKILFMKESTEGVDDNNNI